MNHSQLIGDFVTEMYQAQTFEARFNIYGRYIQKLHFDYAVYAYLPKINGAKKSPIITQPLFKMTDEYPKDFVQEYAHRHFEKDDITIKAYNKNKTNPIDWWQYHKNNDMTAQELEVIQVARRDYGMENGLSIPTLQDSRGLAAASVVSTEKGQSYQRLKQENFTTLVYLTKLFHSIVFNEPSSYRAFLPMAFQTLSEKEKRVLQHLVNGYGLKVLEDYTGISQRYGDKLIVKMRKKLGGLSTQQLVYYTGVFDLLK
ncbi:MAG: autoinducer binding domain-containing protein [bacterium]